MSDKIKRLIGASILTAMLILIGIIIPLTLGLGTGEIKEQEVANQIDFYQKFYWGLLVIWGVMLALMFAKNNDKYGDSVGFFGIGKKPAFKFFEKFTSIQLTILSLIFFSTIFLLANFLKLGGFTGLRVLPQQFTKGQSLLFSTLLIPVPENILIGAIISLIIIGLTILSIKYKIDSNEYLTYLYISLFIIGGLFGVVWHQTAYPNSDTANYVIFTFWGLGAVISVATGFFIPFLIMHMTNNFFIDFSRLYSSDTLFTTMIIFIVGLVIFYLWFYKGRWLGGKKTQEILK